MTVGSLAQREGRGIRQVGRDAGGRVQALDFGEAAASDKPYGDDSVTSSERTGQFKNINSLALSFLYSSPLTSIHDYWKKHSFD